MHSEMEVVESPTSPPRMDSPVLSIITPAYNETENLELLYRRLSTVLDAEGISWQWIVVDDHSRDDTFACMRALALKDSRVSALRFARNFGSHRAILCGLTEARGNCSVVMAADLQDPPETLLPLLEQWKQGAQVVWAARAARPGTKTSSLLFSRLYYAIMRRVVGLTEMPSEGADFFLIDARVVRALLQFPESNNSIFALINWMGFHQTVIYYNKEARTKGQSGWTLEKKVKLVLDSVTSFSYFPIRLMSIIGCLVALVGFAYAVLVIRNAMIGLPPTGWASLMVVVLTVGGIQMLMMGVLGEYLWRALEESRRRPAYLVEDSTGAVQGRPGAG